MKLKIGNHPKMKNLLRYFLNLQNIDYKITHNHIYYD
jgi:hypothetical protein